MKSPDGGTIITGLPFSGKTYFMLSKMQGWRGPALCINTTAGKVPAGWLRADGGSDMSAVIECLRAGKKVNFIPAVNEDNARKQMAAIVDALMQEKISNLAVGVDEAQVFAPMGWRQQPAEYLVSRGRHFGVMCSYFSTQKPQDVSRGLRGKCFHHVFFSVGIDAQYLAGLGVPVGLLGDLLSKGGKNSYCVWDMQNISGPFKEKAGIKLKM